MFNSWIGISFREQFVPKTCKLYITEHNLLEGTMLKWVYIIFHIIYEEIFSSISFLVRNDMVLVYYSVKLVYPWRLLVKVFTCLSEIGPGWSTAIINSSLELEYIGRRHRELSNHMSFWIRGTTVTLGHRHSKFNIPKIKHFWIQVFVCISCLNYNNRHFNYYNIIQLC